MAAQFDTQQKNKILDIFFELKDSISSDELNTCIKTKNIACRVGNLEFVRQLFAALKGTLEARPGGGPLTKSIIDSKDNDGYDPMTLAIESNNLHLVIELIREGGDISKNVINSVAR